MVTSKMIILWWQLYASRFPGGYITQYIDGRKRGTKYVEQLKHLSIKIQEVTSTLAITKKNEKQYIRQIILQLGI